jgi:hypothetical protein
VLAAKSMIAGQFADNPASAAVLAKAGFGVFGERSRTSSRGRGCEVETANFRIEF